MRELAGASVTGTRDTLQGGGYRLLTAFLPARAGAASVRVSYEGTPQFWSDSINGMGREWVELGLDSHWLPIVSDHTQLGR